MKKYEDYGIPCPALANSDGSIGGSFIRSAFEYQVRQRVTYKSSDIANFSAILSPLELTSFQTFWAAINRGADVFNADFMVNGDTSADKELRFIQPYTVSTYNSNLFKVQSTFEIISEGTSLTPTDPTDPTDPDPAEPLYELPAPVVGDGSTHVDTGWIPDASTPWTTVLTFTTEAVLTPSTSSGLWDGVDGVFAGLGSGGDYLALRVGDTLDTGYSILASTEYEIKYQWIPSVGITGSWAITINNELYKIYNTVTLGQTELSFYVGGWNNQGIADHFIDYTISDFVVYGDEYVAPELPSDVLYSVHEEDIGTIPLYNASDSDHELISSIADKSKLNSSSAHYFFVEPGDYEDSGAYNITVSGTSGARKYIILNDQSSVHPGALSSASQANLRINLNGADYWVIHRISSLDNDVESTDDYNMGFQFLNQASNNILSLCNVDGFGRVGIAVRDECNDNTVQYCRVANQSHYGRWTDGVGIAMTGDSWNTSATIRRFKIIGNEIYNTNDGIQGIWRDTITRDYPGTIVDNNNIWVDSSIYGDSIWTGSEWSWQGYNPAGKFSISENAIDLKKGSVDPLNPFLITNNRAWGYRKNGRDGDPGTSMGNSFGATYVHVIGNLLFDSHRGAGYNTGSHNGKFNNNILKDCNKLTEVHTDTTEYGCYWYGSSNVEMNENIVVSNGQGYGFQLNNGSTGEANGNVLIDAGVAAVSSSVVASAGNHFYGSTVPSGLVGSDYDTQDPMMGDYEFIYDLYTANPKTKIVTGVVTTTDSPHYVGTI